MYKSSFAVYSSLGYTVIYRESRTHDYIYIYIYTQNKIQPRQRGESIIIQQSGVSLMGRSRSRVFLGKKIRGILSLCHINSARDSGEFNFR